MWIKKLIGRILYEMESSKNTWSKERLAEGAMRGYKFNHGYEFDINKPELFTEKVQWYKIFYDHDRLTDIVDKYLFKGYIKEKLGEGNTIPMYKAWTDIKTLKKDWDSLPDKFILKSTVQSDGNFIKVIHDKNKVDLNKLVKELRPWLNKKRTLINSYCRAYYKAVPRILAEEYVEQIDEQLYDYKIFCFGGKPYCVYVAMDHFNDENYAITFYDLDWNKLDVRYGKHKNADCEKPKHFDKMIEFSEKLAADFPFVRVDFFDTEDKLYLAEMTFYPGGGLVPYYPTEFNKEMGDLFNLPKI